MKLPPTAIQHLAVRLRGSQTRPVLDRRRLPAGFSLPEKDMPIMLAAIEAQATHLLTGDLRHFGSYFGKRIDGILIIPPGEYLRAHLAR